MKQSAGILLYKIQQHEIQMLLVHPGGPFWAKKDDGSWSIPKGEAEEGEELFAAAKREFSEETGLEAEGDFKLLTPLKQKSGKLIHAWALEGDMDVTQLKSNEFEIEWPPKSGKIKSFPEIDRAAWLVPEAALVKILPGQQGFIPELLSYLKTKGSN